MGTVLWDADIAAAYDEGAADMFEPAVLDPTVDILTGLAGEGSALEHRWADWHPQPFTADSPSQVVVYRR